ncbi:hypothetical protein T4D_6870 [Trichinella pseudospiralis]|uniref:Uncharacterized protein n=1 Tax=Trichinella pseudospiralis TaxID=6337 RepID=A0A0V1F978_TRIPS|nr:hypothetical protein T4D_6870 [Trichinella pseudospiralis]
MQYPLIYISDNSSIVVVAVVAVDVVLLKAKEKCIIGEKAERSLLLPILILKQTRSKSTKAWLVKWSASMSMASTVER